MVRNLLWDIYRFIYRKHWRNEMNLMGWVGGEVDGTVGGGPRKALRRMQQI